MNQEKIGKLIAKMRKQKDLTQRELGEMVGVGYRSVSKWERGLTMPDISIINELSTILGISSDELLNGELNPKDDKTEILSTDIDQKPVNKNNKRKLLLLVTSVLVIISFLGIIIFNSMKEPTEYIIKSLNTDEYLVDGTLTVQGDNIIININKIEFQNYNFCQTMIKDYEYSVYFNEKFLFGVNGDYEYDNLYEKVTIKDIVEKISINYKVKKLKEIKSLNKEKITIKLYFTKNDNSLIEKDLDLIISYK